MKGLAMMLKAMGINVTPEHVKAIEDLIPQLPGKLNQVVSTINDALKYFDQRLTTLETQHAEILALLREQNARRTTDTRNASDGRNS
jgi:hypothetical protein